MILDERASLEALLNRAVTLRRKSREIIAEQDRLLARFAAAFELAYRAQEAVETPSGCRDQRPGNRRASQARRGAATRVSGTRRPRTRDSRQTQSAV